MTEPQSRFEDPAGPQNSRPESLEFQAFISYNSKDRQRIKLVVQELDRRGIRVWYDQREKVAGTISADLMADGIARSERCAVFLGEHGEGPWQSEEQQLALAQAVEHGRPVFAVLLPGWGSNHLPPNLQIRTYEDLQDAFTNTGITAEGGDRLEAAMREWSVRELQEWRARQTEPPSASEVTIPPGRWRALVAAVSTYEQQGLSALHGPLSDAGELAQVLDELVLPSGGSWEVTKLLDPTREKLVGAMEQLFAAEGAEDDTVLFYYSGHGVVSGQVSYLCAADTKLDSLSRTGIMAQTIVELLKSSGAARKIVVLDCCHGKPVPIDGDPYKGLGPGVAVIGASQGLAGDATRASEASPFTSELMRIMRSREAQGQAGLTVGVLLDELVRSGQQPWTNTQPDRDILIASRGGSAPPKQRAVAPAIRVTLRSSSVPLDYLPLLRQVARMLDDLVALSDDEEKFPSNAVRSAMRLLGQEFARLLFSQGDRDSLAEALRLAGDNQPPGLELQFENDVVRDAIGDLPWEYLTLHCPSGVPERRDSTDVLRNPWLPVERLVETPPTKDAVPPAPQQVVLFSSLESTAAPTADPPATPHLLTVNATDQLRQLGIKPDVVAPASWPEFLGHSAPANLIILQAPLRWANGNLMIGFSPKQAGQEPRWVDLDSVLGHLKDQRAMIWLVLESVADHQEWQSPTAARKLAERFAQRLEIAVVAVCHPRAFSTCLRDNPHASSFVARLVDELIDGTPLDRAAHVARCDVLNTLAPKEAAVVGIPRVLQPYQREARPPIRKPRTALGSPLKP